MGFPDREENDSHRVQELVPHRRRVHQDQLLEIGVEPVPQRQVHEDRTGGGELEGVLGYRQKAAALIIQGEKQDLFDERQHPGSSRIVAEGRHRLRGRIEHVQQLGESGFLEHVSHEVLK